MKKIIIKLIKVIFSHVDLHQLEDSKLLMGKLLSNQQKNLPIGLFNNYEFKVFSQFGDDGLI